MSTEPVHEVSAGGVVVRHDRDATRVLLIRDSYRNWGFPKGHLEAGEHPDVAALREVAEETGLGELDLVAELPAIDWHFRFRGRQIHKICHFFLMRTTERHTTPQTAEGITACRWATFAEADRLISYDNAREVLRRARALLADRSDRAPALGVAHHPAGDGPRVADRARDVDGPTT